MPNLDELVGEHEHTLVPGLLPIRLGRLLFESAKMLRARYVRDCDCDETATLSVDRKDLKDGSVQRRMYDECVRQNLVKTSDACVEAHTRNLLCELVIAEARAKAMQVALGACQAFPHDVASALTVLFDMCESFPDYDGGLGTLLKALERRNNAKAAGGTTTPE